MTHDELLTLLENPSLSDEQHLDDLMELSQQYPYSAPLHYLVLITLHRMGDLRFSAELHKRALFIPELRHLFLQLRELPLQTPKQLTEEQGEEQTLSTSDIISSFLEEHPEDTTEIEVLIAPVAEPQTDVASLEVHSEVDDSDTPLNTSELIQAFLDRGEEAEVLRPEPTEVLPPSEEREPFQEDELFTETLARIYIRQGKFERAHKILTQVNLEYPKKSSYFAEQIGFLEKIIQNSKQNLQELGRREQ